jgi:hypothetical protein
VEHRHDRQHDIGLADAHAVVDPEPERVQRDRPVCIEDAFRVAGRTGGVAHGDGGLLVRIGPFGERLRVRHQLLVIVRTIGHRLGCVEDDDVFHAHLRLDLLPERQQRFVDEDRAVVGMVDDVGELVGVETEVEGMEDAASERNAEVGLEVGPVVPGEGGDAVSRFDAQVDERLGCAARAAGEIGVAAARD